MHIEVEVFIISRGLNSLHDILKYLQINLKHGILFDIIQLF